MEKAGSLYSIAPNGNELFVRIPEKRWFVYVSSNA